MSVLLYTNPGSSGILPGRFQTGKPPDRSNNQDRYCRLA
jgi:hypothetical protein